MTKDWAEELADAVRNSILRALRAAVAVGRREALVEAARYLREDAQVLDVPGDLARHDDGDATLKAAADVLEARARAIAFPRRQPTETPGGEG